MREVSRILWGTLEWVARARDGRRSNLRRRIRTGFVYFAAIIAICLAGQLVGCGQSSAPTGAGTETRTSREEARGTLGEGRSAERYDLERDEARGGHTLSKHVGRTDEELRERLRREQNISAASMWTDRVTAEEVVAEALRAEHKRLENWMRRGYPRTNLALHSDAGRVIGRSLRRGEDRVVDATQAVIVLRADGPDSFYVLTAYPEARE
jgi:Bacterial CdiA-CT RNAse A domain